MPRGQEDTECLAWGRTWADAGPLSGSKDGSCLGYRTQERPEGGGWEQGWRAVLCGVDLTAALRQENVTEEADASSLHSPPWKCLSYCWRPQACLFPCGLCSYTSPCSLFPWLWEHSDGHSQDPCLQALVTAVNPDSEDSHPRRVASTGAGGQVDATVPGVPPTGRRFHHKLHISRARPPKLSVASGPSEQLLTELPPVSQAPVPLGLSLGQVPLHKVCSMGSGQHWPEPPARRPHCAVTPQSRNLAPPGSQTPRRRGYACGHPSSRSGNPWSTL